MELHFKYLEAVQVADKKIEGEKHVRDPFTLGELRPQISDGQVSLKEFYEATFGLSKAYC